MKYPYIGESTVTERKVLFTLLGVGFDFSRVKMKGGFDESIFKNITEEYLANTYGEVKSKEHAEFIVKLAEVNGFGAYSYSNGDKYFSFRGNCLYFWCDNDVATCGDYKQITIPLPPECESVDEWPKVGDEVQTNFGKGVVELPPDVKGCFVVQVNGGYLQLKIDELQKPKTLEQELLDELHAHFEKYTFADQAINELPLKYNITKKGEVDD